MSPCFIDIQFSGPGEKRWNAYSDRDGQEVCVKGDISPRELAIVKWASNKLREINAECCTEAAP